MRLVDCFLKPLAYAAYLGGLSDDAAVTLPQATQNLHRLLAESEQMASQADFVQQEYHEARFAVCAWIDETILNSDWPERDQWLGALLQRMFYATNRAGEEFYTRMQNLSDSNIQVLEVFHHCLALGFKGRYFSPEMADELEAIKKYELSRHLRDTVLVAVDPQGKFFPEAYLQKAVPRRRNLPRVALSFVTLFMILAPLLFLTLTYFSYSKSLDGMVENMIHLEAK